MLTKLVATAVGGWVETDDSMLTKVGKRLTAQEGAVRVALASITRMAQHAISAEQHRVHGAPDADV